MCLRGQAIARPSCAPTTAFCGTPSSPPVLSLYIHPQAAAARDARTPVVSWLPHTAPSFRSHSVPGSALPLLSHSPSSGHVCFCAVHCQSCFQVPAASWFTGPLADLLLLHSLTFAHSLHDHTRSLQSSPAHASHLLLTI